MTGHGEARLRTLYDLTHSEDCRSHLQQHTQTLATGEPFRIGSRLVRADASHVRAASDAALTRDGNGRLAGVVLAGGGALVLRSQAGQGTTANLFLPKPRTPDRTPADAAAGDVPAPAAAEPRRIMLVDDDAEVLEAINEMLEAAGYAVVSFSSALLALSHLEHGGPADLLITDLSMPGTDGLGLIGEAQRRWPGMPSILLTGYNSDELAPATALLTGGRLVVLQKPIRLGALLKQVAALLAETGGAAG